MTYDARLSAYQGRGLLADRPVTPATAPTIMTTYYAYDTAQFFVWDPDLALWGEETGGLTFGDYWNDEDAMMGGLVVHENKKAISGLFANTTFASIRSKGSQSSGKLYFEFVLDRISNSSPYIGVAEATHALDNFVGAEVNGWATDAVGNIWTNGASSAESAPSEGDVIGVAVDFTAATGSVKFYLNNVANGSYTGLTLGTLFIMASVDGVEGSPKGTVRTIQAECSYSPPATYDYWG